MKLNWQQWVALTIFFIIAFLAVHLFACHENWLVKIASAVTLYLTHLFYERSGIWRKISENLDDD